MGVNLKTLFFLCVFSPLLVFADSAATWLSFKGKSTNELVWENKPLLDAALPTKLGEEIRSSLGGPPDPVMVEENRYVSLSACRHQDCPSKGFLWVDTKSNGSVGGHFQDGVLQIELRNLSEVPVPASSAIRQWLTEHDVELGSVQLVSSSKTSSLDPSLFAPKPRFKPTNEGPSFDCAKAATEIEKTICKTPSLALSDLKLSKKYSSIRGGHSTTTARDELKEFQRQWVNKRNSTCSTSSSLTVCLKAEYEVQYKALGNWLPKGAR
jgi:uncharacterized protein YecT (DUF1311 family)